MGLKLIWQESIFLVIAAIRPVGISANLLADSKADDWVPIYIVPCSVSERINSGSQSNSLKHIVKQSWYETKLCDKYSR